MKFNAKGTLGQILDGKKSVFENCNRLMDDFKDDGLVSPVSMMPLLFLKLSS